MRYSITAHKIIAILSFLILSSVQFFLLYNTYELENDHYFLAEKSILNREYSRAISNDKVMPGGQRLLDSFINRHMNEMEQLYFHDRPAFNNQRQRILDSAFLALQHANNIDSLLNAIIRRNNLRRNFEYALIIPAVDLAFQGDNYISLYTRSERYPLIERDIQTKDGIRIGGTLRSISTRNVVSTMTVSSPENYTYRINFALYVDIRDRNVTILRRMMPTFLLSLFSVLSVVLLFFITFRNWLRQKKLSEMKSDFINSITHEFHTPLAAIIVANKTMQNEKIISSKENIRPLTEVVQRQAERLRILISQVLDITTLNKISLQKEEYSVHLLLDELLLDYRLRLTDANTLFMLQKNAPRDIVLLDRFWFTTILLNIFDNAIKYNDKEEKEITVTTFEDKRTLYISIRDNGIGMTEETQRHIFEKFYRNMRHTKDTIKGLGLGLFYVKQAIDAHNWKIEIVSTTGEGSIFVISIPL